jgi:DNA processing protein
VDPYLLLAVAEGCDEAPVAALLDPTADPAALLAAPPSLPARVRRRLADPTLPAQAACLAADAAELGLALLTPADDGYPAALRAAPLRPLLLFARGDLGALGGDRLAIAVVGSRTPTAYGIAATAEFAAALARAGVLLWSGLARGIDAEAHAQSLRHGTPTVAVLAGGLADVYPAAHRDLAAAIVAAGGCLLSEAPPHHRPRRGHFPRRNRILAGATAATLVTEAGTTSGALLTARFAAECGRAVFAVPGPYTSERSRGCHRLIADGAQIAADPVELLRDLGLQPAPSPAAAHALQCSADAAALLAVLQRGPRPAELVARESGLDRAQFLQALFQLEQQGALRRLPGDLLTVNT